MQLPVETYVGEWYTFPFVKGKAPEMMILSNSIALTSPLLFLVLTDTPEDLRMIDNTSVLH